MRIVLTEGSQATPVPLSFFEEIAAAAACLEEVAEPVLLALTLTDDVGIRAINKQWRHLDASTDVLSFPAVVFSPQETAGLEQASFPADAWDSDEGAYFLGDIVISLPAAFSQAEEYGHGMARELAYLFVHGVMHLMGYDHQNPEDKKQMRDMEEKTLAKAAVAGNDDQALIKIAWEAREYAYTPYSRYKVGAALRSKNGQVYTGCNIENAAFGLTNCAERTALFKAISVGDTEFDAIAITADATAPWPCGACRQALSEFVPGIRVLISWNEGKENAESTLDQLLPHSFLGYKEDGQ
ncbi:MAG: cytidine deaminase [Eubacteriales bacterium]|nr:cytidine deaminase [Eubacteriales bacterium]